MNWRRYIPLDLPAPTAADRAWLEKQLGRALPDAYWALASQRQGSIPEPGSYRAGGAQGSIGVFLHVLGPDRLAGPAYPYGVFPIYESTKARWSDALIPFADDTGGNRLALDYRGSGGPAIVFLDHEREGLPEGIVHVAPSFAALMAAAEG